MSLVQMMPGCLLIRQETRTAYPLRQARCSLAHTISERFVMAALVSWYSLPDANYCPG